MKVKDLITELQKCDQDADVKTHYYMGSDALFVCKANNIPGVVWIEDMDGMINIVKHCESAYERETFFKELKKIGISLEDIESNYPEIYDAAKKYYKN